MLIFTPLLWIWIAIGFITFLVLVLFKIKAPYGRHSSVKWGKMIDNKWGWFWMELPAFLLFPILCISGPSNMDVLSWILVILWISHYAYRTLLFPFRLKTKGKKMPLFIMFSGMVFNGINGYFNGYYLGFIRESSSSLFATNVAIGIVIFFIGMYINRVSDNKLIALRNGTNEYKIPKGWLFEYVSCPNHLGEIIEWIGFALVAWNLPAFSFAFWTFCNLVPRTLNHHEWYKNKFSNYPPNRKAVFPFIW